MFASSSTAAPRSRRSRSTSRSRPRSVPQWRSAAEFPWTKRAQRDLSEQDRRGPPGDACPPERLTVPFVARPKAPAGAGTVTRLLREPPWLREAGQDRRCGRMPGVPAGLPRLVLSRLLLSTGQFALTVHARVVGRLWDAAGLPGRS